MRIDRVSDGDVRISLSRHNLLHLLYQLDTYGSNEEKSLTKYQRDKEKILVVYAEEDEPHYKDGAFRTATSSEFDKYCQTFQVMRRLAGYGAKGVENGNKD